MKKLSLLIFAFILFSCGGEKNDPLMFPSLTITNQHDILSIEEVSLTGYKFESLSINFNQSKTFRLSDGINGGMNNVNIVIKYGCGGRGWTKNTSVNFSNGNDTSITIVDPFDRGDGGCQDVGFE